MSVQLRKWLSKLDIVDSKIQQLPAFRQYGKLTRATGLVMEAVGLKLPIGALCIIERETTQGIVPVESEVVGFQGQTLFLMPLEHVDGIQPGARIYAFSADHGAEKALPVGPQLLGRVLDAQ
jgi:flagellum-specific ATP synthase